MNVLVGALAVIAAGSALLALRRRRLRRLQAELGPGRGNVPRADPRDFPAVDVYGNLVAQGDQSFRDVTRFTQQQFLDLLAEVRGAIEANRQVRPHVEPTGRYHPAKLTTENRLLLGLKFLVCAESNTSLATQFGESPQAISEEIRHVVYALAGTLHYEIQWPGFDRRQRLSELLGPEFHTAFGTVDGTFTPTFHLRGDYSGHRHMDVRSHQIACDALGYIVHIVAGQLGSRHDAWNFQRSELPELLRACGSQLLADSGYEGTGGTLITPSAADRLREEEQELWREIHTSRRSRVEQFIGVLKALFRVVGHRWQRTDRAFLSVCVIASAMLYNRVKRLRR